MLKVTKIIPCLARAISVEPHDPHDEVKDSDNFPFVINYLCAKTYFSYIIQPE